MSNTRTLLFLSPVNDVISWRAVCFFVAGVTLSLTLTRVHE
jgi:hypothetical protein